VERKSCRVEWLVQSKYRFLELAMPKLPPGPPPSDDVGLPLILALSQTFDFFSQSFSIHIIEKDILTEKTWIIVHISPFYTRITQTCTASATAAHSNREFDAAEKLFPDTPVAQTFVPA
jgi:hypothetical protein